MARAESKKRTKLAGERTRLAYHRTIMAYIRTATTVILFGIAFLGISKKLWGFFFTTGLISVAVGLVFIFLAIIAGIKHARMLK